MEAPLTALALPINGKKCLILITAGIARLFLVTLSGASGATITDAQGQGTIVIGETTKTVSVTVNGDTTKSSWWISAALSARRSVSAAS